MDKNFKLSKNDNKLFEIARDVSDNYDDVEIVLIGGRALNFLVDEIRFSTDSDFGVRREDGDEISQKKFKKFSKKVIKEIEEKFKINIEFVGTNEIEAQFRREQKNYYRAYKFLYKIFVFIDMDYYILELSRDETIDKMNPWESKLGIKIAPIEFILAIKTIILAKKINNETIFLDSNHRHIYDICRMVKKENFDFDKLIIEMHKIHEYEKVRHGNEKFKYELQFSHISNIITDWLKSEIKEIEIDKTGKMIKLNNNFDKIMFLNEKTYETKFVSKDREKISDFLKKIEKLLKN